MYLTLFLKYAVYKNEKNICRYFLLSFKSIHVRQVLYSFDKKFL